jgi:hypothetical protein
MICLIFKGEKMVKHFNAGIILGRAIKVLERSGVKAHVLTSKEKEIEIKCCNLNKDIVKPGEVYESALQLLDQKGYPGKKEISFDGKSIYFSSTAVTAMREEFGADKNSLTYPQQI